jgi:hypothetical protein
MTCQGFKWFVISREQPGREGPTIDLQRLLALLRRAGEYGSCRRGSSSRWPCFPSLT